MVKVEIKWNKKNQIENMVDTKSHLKSLKYNPGENNKVKEKRTKPEQDRI